MSSRSSSDSSYYKERTSSLRNFYEIPKQYCKTKSQMVVVKDYETTNRDGGGLKSSTSSSDDNKAPRPVPRSTAANENRHKSNSIDNDAKTRAPAVAMVTTGESVSKLTRLRKSMTISSIKTPIKQSTGLFHFLDFKNLCILMSCRSDYGRLGNPATPSASKSKEPASKLAEQPKERMVNQFTKIEYTAEDLDEMDKLNERMRRCHGDKQNQDIYQDPLSLLSQPVPRMVSIARPEEVNSDDFSFSSTEEESSSKRDNGSARVCWNGRL